jgi:iron complex outermembrane receptor protein
LAWTPSDRQTVWAAVSRAVRTPNRSEDDTHVNEPAPAPFPPGTVMSFLGNRNGMSEDLLAYELGYRIIPCSRLTFDAATFYNVYEHLRSLEGPVAAPPPAAFALVTGNGLKGESYGVEASGRWQATDWWNWQAGYTFIRLALHRYASGTDSSSEHFFEGNSPQHQVYVTSRLDLPCHFQVDTTLRYVDSLDALSIPSYVVMDARVAWSPSRHWEIAVVGQNLFDKQHSEFSPTVIAAPQTQVEQSVYAKVTWRY